MPVILYLAGEFSDHLVYVGSVDSLVAVQEEPHKAHCIVRFVADITHDEDLWFLVNSNRGRALLGSSQARDQSGQHNSISQRRHCHWSSRTEKGYDEYTLDTEKSFCIDWNTVLEGPGAVSTVPSPAP